MNLKKNLKVPQECTTFLLVSHKNNFAFISSVLHRPYALSEFSFIREKQIQPLLPHSLCVVPEETKTLVCSKDFWDFPFGS